MGKSKGVVISLTVEEWEALLEAALLSNIRDVILKGHSRPVIEILQEAEEKIMYKLNLI